VEAGLRDPARRPREAEEDPEHALQKSWSLGDCDDKDLVIIIGKDRKVAFFKAGKLEPAEMEPAFGIIKDLMAR
jgi:predicted transcriptional regulator